MAFLEPSGPPGRAPYREPNQSRSAWLALANDIEPEVARYFLVSARCGCFMQAARSLNIKATLLRKRLARLEEQLHHALFSYQGNGLVLSRDGQQLQAQLLAIAAEYQTVALVAEQRMVQLLFQLRQAFAQQRRLDIQAARRLHETAAARTHQKVARDLRLDVVGQGQPGATGLIRLAIGCAPRGARRF